MTARSKLRGPRYLTVLLDPGLIRVKRYMCEKVTVGPVYSKSAFDYLGELSAICNVAFFRGLAELFDKKRGVKNF
jgi:hypothetical protein